MNAAKKARHFTTKNSVHKGSTKEKCISEFPLSVCSVYLVAEW